MSSSDDENQQRTEEDQRVQAEDQRERENFRLLEDEEERRREFHSQIDERLNNLEVPEYAMKVIKMEQDKLRNMDGTESGFDNTKTHLEWLTNIPWGKTSEDNIDVHSMRQILDEDLFGLNNEKEKILEFIECEKWKIGKILCLCGPHGVGKTSIAKSIARAMGRQYCDFSVAGANGNDIFDGYKTEPGKLIQCLKEAQTENPLILIDEIHLLNRGIFPAFLKTTLHPKQISNFFDDYIEVPVDLSKVLFVCSATDRINSMQSLLENNKLDERVELIEVPGYVTEEKMEIAKKNLIPKLQKEYGLMNDKLMVKDNALKLLIKSYCSESGVHNLEKHLKKIYQSQEKRLKGDKMEKSLVVSSGQIKDFFGPRKYVNQRLFEDENTPSGITISPATSFEFGGLINYNEVRLARKLDLDQQAMGSLKVIGDLSDEVKNSIEIAYTVAKNVLWHRDPKNVFLDHAHINFCISHSEGAAIKTEGTSGGAAKVSAFLSLALDLPVRGIVMTGAITLHGNILPISGVKNKIDAVKNMGITQLILPEENREEFEALDDFVKRGITVHFVSHYDQIFPIIFPNFKPKTGIDKCDENKNVD